MIVDTITLILDRLEINIKEILGNNSRVFRLAPSIIVSSEQYPYSVVRWGRSTRSMPRDYNGKVVIPREFYIDLFVKPVTNTIDIDDQGALALTLVAPYIQKFQDYFISEHPRLDTVGIYQTKLRELQWIFEDVLIGDSGLIKLVGAGGDICSGVTFTLSIDMYSIVTRNS